MVHVSDVSRKCMLSGGHTLQSLSIVTCGFHLHLHLNQASLSFYLSLFRRIHKHVLSIHRRFWVSDLQSYEHDRGDAIIARVSRTAALASTSCTSHRSQHCSPSSKWYHPVRCKCPVGRAPEAAARHQGSFK